MQDLKERTIRGGFARICAQAANFLLRFVSLMVLARLLGPNEFGLIGMVTAITGILNLFRDFGLSAAAVQRDNVTEEQISTLFWINVLVGFLLSGALILLAPLIAHFYHEPRLRWITVVISLSFVFNAVGVQHAALLQRQMRFTAIAVINTLSLFISTVTAVVMAKAGYGHWALVAMTVAIPLTNTIGLWIAETWTPGWPYRRTGLGSMMRFGSTLTLNSIVIYIAYNMEKVLLGRYWGADAIGVYGRAYQLINIPTENLNFAVGEVAFSALSRVQNDAARLRNYFLKGYSLVLGFTIPITVLCALFAGEIVTVFLGPKWHDTVPVFRLLVPTVLAFALINPTSWLLYSLGRVDRSLKIALVIAPLVITGYVLGLPYGPKGVAFGYSAAMAIWVLPHLAWSVHGTAISFSDLIETLRRPVISGVVAAVLPVVFHLTWGMRLAPFLRLVLGGSLFMVIYLGLLLYVMGQKEFYLDLFRGLRGRSSESGTLSAHA